MEPPDLVFLLQRNTEIIGKVLPLSLLSYRCCCLAYSLPREKMDFTDATFQEVFHSQSSMSEKTLQNNEMNFDQTYGANSDETVRLADSALRKSEPHFDGNTTLQSHFDKKKTGTQVQPHSDVAEGGQAKSMIKHGQYLPLQHCFRKHVKPKKQHEILQLGQVINVLGTACESSYVVDVGAGQGHLARILNFGYGLKVTTVEAAGCHAPKAQKFDRDMQNDINRVALQRKFAGSKEKNSVPEAVMDSQSHKTLPDHVTCIIHPNISVDNFLHVVQSSFRKHSFELDIEHCQHLHVDNTSSENNTDRDTSTSTQDARTSGVEVTDSDKCDKFRILDIVDTESEEHIKFILTGLHACGDLTPTILRVYSKCPDIIGLTSVSCCYMKLTCNKNDSPNQDNGYPMSRFVKNLLDHHLSYEAREMACHFADAYSQRLKDNRPSLKLHCYRAVLQYIIAKIKPDFQRGCIKLTVKNAENMTFEQYAKIGLQHLGIENDIPTDVLQDAMSYLPSWRTVVVFYAIRLSLAPVVETLLLLDRMLYLHEQGLASCLIPIFDPNLSPRNFVLLSRKT